MKYLFNFVALMLTVVSVAGAAANSNSTLHNLQTAYNGESNARAKYLKFAKKAEQEGYGQVASLFRAAAAAEQIHRTCEASVIKEMDATPQAKIALPPIKSTKQNLEDSASKGEAYERDTMYPQFIKQARTAATIAPRNAFPMPKPPRQSISTCSMLPLVTSPR
jgi:rubrerythrin